MGLIENVRDFFELPPKHNLKVGDLVTCTCHGGVAIVMELYDDPGKIDYPKMNMAKIFILLQETFVLWRVLMMLLIGELM